MSVVARPDVKVVDAASFAAASGATPQQIADLTRFREMLAAGNEVMNLVGPATIPDFWNRHAWDSAQLLELAPEAKTWADLGAGAGFPGLVLAILGKGREGFHVHLVAILQAEVFFNSFHQQFSFYTVFFRLVDPGMDADLP